MKLMRALLVDSDPVHRRRVRSALEARKFEVVEAGAFGEALPFLSLEGLDLVVAEFRQPQGPDALSIDMLVKHGALGARPPPIILYLDAFARSSLGPLGDTAANAILLPTPVMSTDLDAALERAFDADDDPADPDAD